MWVFRLLSGSHITCDSMISGSRDMAAQNGGARRTVTALTESPHSTAPAAALSAHCAAPCGALRFKGRFTARRGNLPRRRRSAPRPSECVLPLHRRPSAGSARQLGCFSSLDSRELADVAQSGTAACNALPSKSGRPGKTRDCGNRAAPCPPARRWGHPGVKRSVAARGGEKSGRCPRALRVAAQPLPSCAEM